MSQHPSTSACDLEASSSAASEVNNLSSCDKSDIRLEENLTTLSEMFPECDVTILRNYLEIFRENPNCMPIVVGMVLEGGATSGFSSEQSSPQQSHGLKRKTNTATSENSLHNEGQGETAAASPSKPKKVALSKNKSKCSSLPTVVEKVEDHDRNSDKIETSTSLGTPSVKKKEASSSNSYKNETSPSTWSGHLVAGEQTSTADKDDDNNDDDDDEIVFFKSVASPPKKSFHRTAQSNPETTPPRQRNGICIRYKGGTLHPSMYKPKSCQIVQVHVQGTSGSGNVQMPLNGDQSPPSISPRRRGLGNSRTYSTKAATATATTDTDDSSDTPFKPCTSSGLSKSRNETIGDSSTPSPGSSELNQTEEAAAYTGSKSSPVSNSWSTKTVTATVTTDSDNSSDSLFKPCTSSGLSKSIGKATRNHSTPSPRPAELDLTEEATASSSSESSSIAAALSDLEILKKVFPDADPTYISSLLEKYKDKPNRVALVGKELGSNSGTQEQNRKKSVAPSVTWFWESESGKLVPFTDAESNTLEREFNTWDGTNRSHPGDAFPKLIRLPGSTKHFTVDFNLMNMVCESGQKTLIFRVPGGSDERKEIRGKSLIPQEALTLPSDWQQQSGNAELISVRPGSAEWDHVQRSLVRSLRIAQVVDIQRVQNQWLYRKYAIQRHLLKDKNGPTCINEKELFHGTRLTNPNAIWTGEDGFDMRYSADGMWGRGTYFASEAAYCHQGFVYHDAQTQKFQLFLAHVLTGDSITLAPDRSIKMPPLKRGSNIRYDSVNGVTNGCTVYILYKLDMAYPAYLITYTLKH